jgi:hypothetical protein
MRTTGNLHVSGRATRRAVHLLALAFATGAVTGGARADLTLQSTITTTMESGEDTLHVVSYFRGPWMRRDVLVTGALASFMKEQHEITHRPTGRLWRLSRDLPTRTVDSTDRPGCGALDLFDLRLLGRVQSGPGGRVTGTDSVTEILGARARGVRIEVESAYSGVTSIDVWMCEEPDKVFGPDYARDLLCGRDSSASPWARDLARDLAERFRLGDDDRRLLAERLTGLPVRIESRSGGPSHTLSRTRFTVEAVSTDPVADSLFEVEPKRDAPSGAGEERP